MGVDDKRQLEVSSQKEKVLCIVCYEDHFSTVGPIFDGIACHKKISILTYLPIRISSKFHKIRYISEQVANLKIR